VGPENSNNKTIATIVTLIFILIFFKYNQILMYKLEIHGCQHFILF